MTRRILIAGIGNIFLGDDAFGVETTRELLKCRLPEGVNVVDFGIRSYDLAFTIQEGYDVVILLDATSRGEEPGTIFLVEIDPDEIGESEDELLNSHGLNPAAVLRMLASLGGQRPRQFYLVGCEPAILETENGEMGLSPKVQAAIPQAIEMIQSLLADFGRERKEYGLVGTGTGVKSYDE